MLSEELAFPDLLARLNNAVARHDLPALEQLVAQGAKLNFRDESGDPWLVGVVSDVCLDLSDDAEHSSGLRTIAKLIDLGADPNQLIEHEDCSLNILIDPIFSQDIAMVTLLLENGVDPNRGGDRETLYDTAWIDYYYEAWLKLPGAPMGDALPEDYRTEDDWLRFVDREAMSKGRPKPDICWLLRRYGALSGMEMRALMGLPEKTAIEWRDGAWRAIAPSHGASARS